MTRKHLMSHESDLSYVTQHVKQYQIVTVSPHGHYPRMIKVLHQAYHRQIPLMTSLSEQLGDALVFGHISYEIIKDHQIWL